MKQKMVFVQTFVVGDGLPIVLDPLIWTDSQVAGAASVAKNVIFFEEVLDSGMVYDTETHRFEYADGEQIEDQNQAAWTVQKLSYGV